MSTTQIPTHITPTTPTPTAHRQPVWKHGVAAAVLLGRVRMAGR